VRGRYTTTVVIITMRVSYTCTNVQPTAPSKVVICSSTVTFKVVNGLFWQQHVLPGSTWFRVKNHHAVRCCSCKLARACHNTLRQSVSVYEHAVTAWCPETLSSQFAE
jgi:hypothetical protein